MKLNIASYKNKHGQENYHTLESDHLIAITQEGKQKVVRERWYYLDFLGRRSDIIYFSLDQARLNIKDQYSSWQTDFKIL